jgi:hypothetical protein
MPSDKGGNFCLSNPVTYRDAVKDHLESSRVYRILSNVDLLKVESNINQVWREVCHRRKIPKHIETHYITSCSSLPVFKGLVKTHKPGPVLKIRPVISSIDGPTYKLSWLLQKVLQKFANCKPHSALNSDSIISHLQKQPMEVLNFHSFPFSLDVVEMFTSIPPDEAIEVLYERINDEKFSYFGILPNDIKSLLRVVLNNNYFRSYNLYFKQMTGLPMGSKLSGLLADVFMDHLENIVLNSLPTPLYYRYVDDCLLIVDSKETALDVLNTFNQLHQNIKFEIELPIENGCLSLLDFTLQIHNGKISTSPYIKPIKSDLFMHGNTALPSSTKMNIITNEWERIKSKCSGNALMKNERKRFCNKLMNNGHTNIPHLSLQPRLTTEVMEGPVFYLNIPFVSDEANTLIKRALKPLKLNIRLSHRSKQMKELLKPPLSVGPTPSILSCHIKNCPVRSHLCLSKFVVYKVTCNKCNEFYIGSTKKHLHLRIREHIKMKESNLFQHKMTCKSGWTIVVLSRNGNVTEMRMKEAILIQQQHPTINKKENLFSLSYLPLI